jgi:hypothetical protein
LIWHPYSHSLRQNSLWIYALAPSTTLKLGTSYLWNKIASCAFFSLAMGGALVQPSAVQNTCAALLPCLNLKLEKMVSVKQVTNRWWCISCLPFVVNLLKILWCDIRVTPPPPLCGHKLGPVCRFNPDSTFLIQGCSINSATILHVTLHGSVHTGIFILLSTSEKGSYHTGSRTTCVTS